VNTIESPAASPLSFPRLVSNMRVIALTLDSRARVTYCNRFFLEITGWTHREVLGCDWFDRFIPPDADELAGVFADLLRDSPEAWHHENEILRKSGERLLVRWNNAVLRGPKDEIVGVATIGEDITERRYLERELLDSAAEERLHLAAELHDGLGQSLPPEGWLSMRIPGRPRTIKPWFSRRFTRLWMPRWILPEVFGLGRWWAV
jgi:PAS domain S-box-containing protein